MDIVQNQHYACAVLDAVEHWGGNILDVPEQAERYADE
jgi:hypothetical protein